MAGRLPEGLISNKRGGVTVGIEDAVGLQAEDTLKLWRSMLPELSFLLAGQLTMSSLVFSSGNAAIAENVGRRLENFFWRIAMSERVRERLSGAQIDKQFDGISQGGYIRTTPKPSPRSSRHLDSYDTEAHSTDSTKSAVPSSPASPKARPVDSDDELQETSVTPTPPSHLRTISEATTTKPKENRRTTTTRPPPILKKVGSGSNQSSRSASLLSPTSQELWSTAGAAGEEAVTFDDDATSPESQAPVAGKAVRKSTTTRFNEEVAVSIPKVSAVSRSSGGRPVGESNQRPGRRNPIVVASTGASKRRPHVMRQRSSQASSLGTSKEAPSRSSSSPNLARVMNPTSTNTAKTNSPEGGALSVRRLRAASPHPSKSREGSSPNSPPSETAEDFGGEVAGAQEPSTNPPSKLGPVKENPNANLEGSKPLVDPDFRSIFVDRTRPSIRSLTNISSFARKSNAAAPTAASFQASGMLDAGQAISTTGRSRGKEAFQNEIVPLKAPASAGPEAPAEAPEPLPRTKSQLTLLLEREKNRSAGQEY